MATDTQHDSDQTELATTCRLVAGFWLNEVDQNRLELLRDLQVQSAWSELGGSVPAEETQSAETLDRLAADYCQLLIGPKKHLPPVQSVWSDHTFQAKAASSTGRFYELYAGYQPPGTIFDHLGCQLHFAAFLLDQVSHGQDHGQVASQVLAQFQREHLTWAEQLLDRVTQKADTEFYRGLAIVTGKLIKELSR